MDHRLRNAERRYHADPTEESLEALNRVRQLIGILQYGHCDNCVKDDLLLATCDNCGGPEECLACSSEENCGEHIICTECREQCSVCGYGTFCPKCHTHVCGTCEGIMCEGCTMNFLAEDGSMVCQRCYDQTPQSFPSASRRRNPAEIPQETNRRSKLNAQRNPRGVPRFDDKRRIPRDVYGKLGGQTHRNKSLDPAISAETRDFIRQNFYQCEDCQPLVVKVGAHWGLSGPHHYRRKTKAVESWERFFNHIIVDHKIPLDLLASAFNVYPRTIHAYAVSQPFSAGTKFIKKIAYMFGTDLIHLSSSESGSAGNMRRWEGLLHNLDQSSTFFRRRNPDDRLRRLERSSYDDPENRERYEQELIRAGRLRESLELLAARTPMEYSALHRLWAACENTPYSIMVHMEFPNHFNRYREYVLGGMETQYDSDHALLYLTFHHGDGHFGNVLSYFIGRGFGPRIPSSPDSMAYSEEISEESLFFSRFVNFSIVDTADTNRDVTDQYVSRRNPEEGGYSPIHDDHHPKPGDTFRDTWQGNVYIALSEDFLATIADDGQRLWLARPLKKNFDPIDLPLWEVPKTWDITREHFNELMANRDDLLLDNLTPTQRKVMLVMEDLEAGIPPMQVSEKHNIDLKTIKRHLTQLGRLDLYKSVRHKKARRKKRVGGKYKGDDFWDAVIADIKSGTHYNDVAEKYGMTTHSKRGTLFRRLREDGLLDAVQLRDGLHGINKISPSDWVSILDNIMAGSSIRDAIEGYDMVRTNVNSFLKKFGTSPGRIREEGLPPALRELLEKAVGISI